MTRQSARRMVCPCQDDIARIRGSEAAKPLDTIKAEIAAARREQ